VSQELVENNRFCCRIHVCTNGES